MVESNLTTSTEQTCHRARPPSGAVGALPRGEVGTVAPSLACNGRLPPSAAALREVVDRQEAAAHKARSNTLLHADEQLRGAYGAPSSLAGEQHVGWAEST
jgi:hypothetical protein